jgi:hypothetical protein
MSFKISIISNTRNSSTNKQKIAEIQIIQKMKILENSRTKE